MAARLFLVGRGGASLFVRFSTECVRLCHQFYPYSPLESGGLGSDEVRSCWLMAVCRWVQAFQDARAIRRALWECSRGACRQTCVRPSLGGPRDPHGRGGGAELTPPRPNALIPGLHGRRKATCHLLCQKKNIIILLLSRNIQPEKRTHGHRQGHQRPDHRRSKCPL